MNRAKGFTLIELMIVVAIVGILAAIAYPSYMEQVRQTKRSDCAGVLAGFGNAMERYFTVNSTYRGAAAGGADLGAPAPNVYGAQCPADAGPATYNLRISAATATSYTIQAQPTGSQAGDECGTLTLDSVGNKDIAGAAAGKTAADCW